MPVETQEQRRAYIQALIRERQSYEQKGLTDRVAEVDKQLAALGEKTSKPQDRAEKRLGNQGETRKESSSSSTPSAESLPVMPAATPAVRSPATPSGSD